MTEPLGQDFFRRPRMTRWFNPILLAKLLWRVVIADLFGQFADRRLIMAALDTVPVSELLDRADLSKSVPAEGPLWIDYVSDLGDGFDSTYAVAYWLAQKGIVLDGADTPLPRGSLLVMGGDEVYPTATAQDYRNRLRSPYAAAFPDDDPEAEHHPLVFMIPGNHDWYDGLVQFLAFFCRQKPLRFGHWRTRQRRSYFALQLRPDWWLWAIDIALTEDLDQPQADYFAAIADAMPEHARIILCSGEPGWYDAESKAGSFRSLHYAAAIANNAKLADGRAKSFKIVAGLSGDTHHYARYSSQFGTQFVTSGGGGAFLHGTQGLKDEIRLDWLKERNAILSLKTEPGVDHAPSERRACYPSQEESRSLLLRNLLFPVLNWDFALALGIIYWPLGSVLIPDFRTATAVILFVVLAIGFVGYGAYQERGKILESRLSGVRDPDDDYEVEKAMDRASVLIPAFAHVAFQLGALWLLAYALHRFNVHLFGPENGGWPRFFLFGLEMVPLGGALAGFIFGVNLLITAYFFDTNHTDAFSALRLDSHRHFLRLCIDGDRLTIYPLGLDRVPKRREWRANPKRGQETFASLFIPPDGFEPRLIEGPIVIDAGRVGAAAKAVKPEALPEQGEHELKPTS